MVQEGIKIPESRIDSAGIWFSASDPSVTPPGAATVNTCFITVPFAHRLRSASMTCEDIDNVGAMTCNLMQCDPGDAKAGTSVDELDDTELAATSDVISQFDFTLNAADKVETSAGRRYFVALVGDNAGDGIEAPALSICVEPVTRSRL